MTATLADSPLSVRARDVLKRAGNPFRNYFARNPDDEVCARFHVPELYAPERDLLHAIIDLYRYDAHAHSEIVPVLGNKGAGKTHLLHSIKHGSTGQWQLLVTPGVYQKDSDFLEYLLFQIIDALLGGGKQMGQRPLVYLGEQLVRRQLTVALRELDDAAKLALFPPTGLGGWFAGFGVGTAQARTRSERLAEDLTAYSTVARMPTPLAQALASAGLSPERAFDLVAAFIECTEAHNTAGLMRRRILEGFAKAALLKDEADLASFLTFGFAELEFHVRPSRQELVLVLFKALIDIFHTLKTPVVVAFDQLEDLLLARRSDDAHRTAEAFFAGIVQAMHQIDGLLFLVFAERGLWNRFVPSLDGYIQDRLNNPVHVPQHGTVKAIRLEAPPAHLVRRVVEARLQPCLDELPDDEPTTEITPFTEDQVIRVAGTEPTLHDMLQQYRHLFDHIVYGPDDVLVGQETGVRSQLNQESGDRRQESGVGRIAELLGDEESEAITFKHVEVIAIPSAGSAAVPAAGLIESRELPSPANGIEPRQNPAAETAALPGEAWDQEQRAARRRLEPDGALTGAARELQAGLGALLATCHEHGVKVGPWRLQHVVPEFTFGEHPTYGAITIAHWACKDGQPWKVGIGLFLARGAGKPKDLEVKLAVMDAQPVVVDHLILLRPEDDLALTGKSKSLWLDAERRGRHARIEPVALEGFAQLSGFPRRLAALRESLPEGTPLPNLADAIQEKCEKLLEQVCMPVQG